MKRRFAVWSLILFAFTCGPVWGQIPRGPSPAAAAASQQRQQAIMEDRQRAEEQRRWNEGLHEANVMRDQQNEAGQHARQEAQVAALRAQQEAWLRAREDITNRVYLHFPHPINPQRLVIIQGQLVNRSELKDVYSLVDDKAEITALSIGKISVVCDVSASTLDRGLIKRIIIFNVPQIETLVTGDTLPSAPVKRVDNYREKLREGREVLEAYDCGLPDSIENRNKAGLAIPTPEQTTAAEQEIEAGLKALVESNVAARKLVAEKAAAAKKAAKDKLLKWHMEQAEKGDSFGMFRMGEHYRDGDGVPKDLGKAREYFTKASDAGSPGAADALSKLNSGSTDLPATR